MRGSHTHSRGFKKKARGSGNRGGKGMAGTGKRADQRKSLVLNMKEKYFGTDKVTRRKQTPALKVINLRDIVLNLSSYVRTGRATESNGAYEIVLKGYKILGEGEVTQKLIIRATAFSPVALEKVKKANGEIIIFETSEKIAKEKQPAEQTKKKTNDKKKVPAKTSK